jgi:hypothetical protein
MEHGQNSKTSEVRNQRLSAFKGGHDHIKHVIALFAFCRHDCTSNAVCFVL